MEPDLKKIQSQFRINYSESSSVNVLLEMDNSGEASQILSGITFDRNNIF